MKKRNLILTTASALAFTASSQALAYDQIIKPYQSVRSSGMGGLKLTTGLYDENIFGNPARRLANPANRVDIFGVMIETNTNAISNVGDFLSNTDDVIATAAESAGENNHARIQLTLPAFYKAPSAAVTSETESAPAGKLAWDLGLFVNSQFDVGLARTFDADIGAIADIGIHGGAAHKFLDDDALGVGINAHLNYRAAARPGYGLVNLLKDDGAILSAGASIDFDLGATYQLPLEWEEFKFEAGASIQNILGGKHTIAHAGNYAGDPPDQPRAFGFGIAAKRPTLWIFRDALVGLEFQDIGNNENGSIFRTVHLGSEVRYGLGVARLGFNQGYITAGLGFLTRVFTLELTTYGEEIGLNMGDNQDRRYALRFAFQI